MITRHYAPIRTKFVNSLYFSLLALVPSTIFGILAILVYVYSDGASLFWPFALALFVLALLMFWRKFNPGTSHEAYVLSERTLAVICSGKQTRFLKQGDLVKYRPFTGAFLLQDGSVFTCQEFDGSLGGRELSRAIVQRWYDDSHQEALLDATHAHQPIANIGSSMSILTCALVIAVMVLGAATKNEDLGTWGLLLLAPAMCTSIIQGYVRRRHIAISLRANGGRHAANAPKRRYVHVLRIPHERPRIASLVAPYMLMYLLLASAVPSVAFLKRHFPAGPELALVANTLYVTAMLGGLYLAWRFYQRIIRGDLFTTLLISPRTIVILHPRRPTRRLRRAQCLAWRAAHDTIELYNGEFFHIGSLPGIDAASCAFLALRRKWWPFVPTETWRAAMFETGSKRPALVSLQRGDYPDAATEASDAYTTK